MIRDSVYCHRKWVTGIVTGIPNMVSASALIVISLFLLLGLGISAHFLAGRDSRAAYADDPMSWV